MRSDSGGRKRHVLSLRPIEKGVFQRDNQNQFEYEYDDEITREARPAYSGSNVREPTGTP